MFVDEFFPKDARSSAQGLFNVLILGVGPFVGNFLGARLGIKFTGADKVTDFRSVFLVPAGIALFAALLLLVFFHPPAKKEAGPAVDQEALGKFAPFPCFRPPGRYKEGVPEVARGQPHSRIVRAIPEVGASCCTVVCSAGCSPCSS